jgi:predicted AlkP superfamily pyrophosphatase or phosphodiesterase
MKLGQGPAIDYLAVSFSMTDIVGHSFGPRSHEVQDVLARLDTVIGTLLDTLDRSVGPRGYVLALAADHGVAPIPEQAKREGLDAGRIESDALKKRLQDAVSGELGRGDFVAAVSTHELYLQPGVRERLAAKPGALARVTAALRAVPGVAEAFAGDELAAGAQQASTPAARAAMLSYFPGRSGDFLVVPRPNWVMGNLGTNHGSINPYDQRVPVVLYGAGVRPGKYERAISPADIAPTLAQAVGVRLEKAEGKPLSEALRASKPAATSSR